MDITGFIAGHRQTVDLSDHNAYRAQLSRQILSLRRRLGLATPKREKFTPRTVTAEDVGSNHEFAHLLILTAERAWSHALHIKRSHTEDASGKGIAGASRRHIISRLEKAAKIARHLAGILTEQNTSKAADQDVLEGRAYAAMLDGAEGFEKQTGGEQGAGERRWQKCLQQYSIARVIYASLYDKQRKDVYQDMLSRYVDDFISYGAYQATRSRTTAVPIVARRFFPKDDIELVNRIEDVDAYALKDKPQATAKGDQKASTQEIPSSITWRGRKAEIVDASIGQALAAVSSAEARLRNYLAEHSSVSNKEKALAYDDVLFASEEAVDAARRAIEDLEKEKVDEGDSRMQDLRVTSLAVNYDLVSWRVGRNRVLVGADDDGRTFEPQAQKKPKRLRKDGTEYPDKEEGRGHKLARLTERVVLLDTNIKSINDVKELRGAMRDAAFVEELDAKVAYFRALKCLNIAYSHVLLQHHVDALALLKRAQDLLAEHLLQDSQSKDKSAPPTLDIQQSSAEALQSHIKAFLTRTHALVELHNLSSASAAAAEKNAAYAPPLVQKLDSYPAVGRQVDLTNLVTYPPRIEPVPVKPLFLDVAWNYIEYPGRKTAPSEGKPKTNGVPQQASQQEEPQKKKGWFGFGR